jgi:transglutaminase-like putative cysteine protease
MTVKLAIQTRLDYGLPAPTDLIVQVEAAMVPEQLVENPAIGLSPVEHFARVPGQDEIGERIMLRAADRLIVEYSATVTIRRVLARIEDLPAVPLHRLPGPTVAYLLESRYCPSHSFERFVAGEFPGLAGGALVGAMVDYMRQHFRYVSGVSTQATTALDTFVSREGVCRDYAHVVIALARAASIPARIASVYAPHVDPPDFHAVCEVFVGDAWHIVDATGMASGADCAKIAVGRDAADVAFLTSFGAATFNSQQISVRRLTA